MLQNILEDNVDVLILVYVYQFDIEYKDRTPVLFTRQISFENVRFRRLSPIHISVHHRLQAAHIPPCK